jgi:hypothetical protein
VSLLLDTHVLVWLDEGSARLGEEAREAIDVAWKAGELAVSAITFWEIATLQRNGASGARAGLVAMACGVARHGLARDCRHG